MRIVSSLLLVVILLTFVSCRTTEGDARWLVEKMEIPLYHSSTADPETGHIAHVEYCGAKLSSGSDVLHIVYRPIDFPSRNPGFSKGDRVNITGIKKAKDFGAIDGPDYWITDIRIAKSANK